MRNALTKTREVITQMDDLVSNIVGLVHIELAYADPESFTRGGPTLQRSFDERIQITL